MTAGFRAASQINNFFGAGPNAPETGDYSYNRNRVEQVKWQSPVTSRLLLESSVGVTWSRWGYEARPGWAVGRLIRVQEQAAIPGVGLAGPEVPLVEPAAWGRSGAYTWNGAASYVTGAHNMKFGYQGAFLKDTDTLINVDQQQPPPGRIASTTRCRTRSRSSAGEFRREVRTEYAAFYAQEQWTHGRLTLQGGAALRPRLEPLPRADDRSGRVHPDPDRDPGHQGRDAASTTSRRGSARPTTCAATARRR